jgi:hypothetical protein
MFARSRVRHGAVPFCLAFLLALVAGPSPAAAQEVVAMVDGVAGRAFLGREAARLTAQRGLEVQRRDEIITLDDGRLRLNFRDGSVVAVGPNSRVLVLHYLDTLGGADSRAPVLDLILGILRLSVPDVGALGWSVRTRAAVASSRSTDWIVEAQADKTAVVVLGGKVVVETPEGAPLRDSLLLTGGEGVDVTLGAPIPDTPTRWGAQRVVRFVERTQVP